MTKRKLFSISIIVLLSIAIPSCLYLLYLKSPQADWDKSPDALVITEERPFAELDYNYIPDFQVWGDGYIVWVEHTSDGKRKVLEGYLTEKQMERLINRFIQADFFKLYRRLYRKDYALPHIRITLLNESYSELMEADDKPIHDLVNFVRNGAGVAGKDYIPAIGRLIVCPIEKTSLPADTKPKYQWPDEKFGYDLEMISTRRPHNEIEITGEELLFAWEIVNSPQPVVESNGKVFWIAIMIPKVSPF